MEGVQVLATLTRQHGATEIQHLVENSRHRPPL
jgi:hypothetical protein